VTVICIVTGPPNGPVLFCWLVSVVCRHRLSASSVTLPAGGRAGRRARGRSGDRHCTAGQYGYIPLVRHLVSSGTTPGVQNGNIPMRQPCTHILHTVTCLVGDSFLWLLMDKVTSCMRLSDGLPLTFSKNKQVWVGWKHGLRRRQFTDTDGRYTSANIDRFSKFFEGNSLRNHCKSSISP